MVYTNQPHAFSGRSWHVHMEGPSLSVGDVKGKRGVSRAFVDLMTGAVLPSRVLSVTATHKA